MAFQSYYPEMGEAKPAAAIEARLSHSGKHWYLRTQLDLSGRGVEFLGVLGEGRLVPGSPYVGWKEYKVTDRAFQLICERHEVVSESLL